MTKTFNFQDMQFEYFDHPYNSTKKNERAIEVPILKNVLDEFNGMKILEVGNVSRHYFPKLTHDVVDFYERMDGVINSDFCDFSSSSKYDIIVSISTFEHIGFDEKGPKNPSKFIKAIDHAKSISKRLFISVPIGYNKIMDSQLKSLDLDKIACMKRVSSDNDWTECSLDEALKHRYGHPFGWANAVAFIYHENKEDK